MISKILTTSNLGLQTQLIECEVDLSPSLPMMVIVGLPDKAVQESKERVKSAIRQSGFEFPLGKITVNLAPADVIKSGSALDLPIAIGIMSLTGDVKVRNFQKSIFLGELSLDGELRAIPGVLTMALWASKNGFDSIFLPAKNSHEAAMAKGINVFPVDNLKSIVNHLNGKSQIPKLEPLSFLISEQSGDELSSSDMAFIKGQLVAKRALEIAASGGHNVLFIGQPGSGKTLLARSYCTILPAMTEEETLEVTQIYSVAGMIDKNKIHSNRPFRAPHHSCSHIALVGGGSKLRPGEISLAHRGVLFLDEFPEFSRESIECLRQPLEDGHVVISRASGTVEYPSKFYLLAAANPTPSGFDQDDPDALKTPQNKNAIIRYQAKFSGPILDRIDLQVEVNRPQKSELQSKELAESSRLIKKRVQNARDIQTKRFEGTGLCTNSEMPLSMIEKYCSLDIATEKLLSQAIDKYRLSARGYMRILKLSRTIADLEGSDNIQLKHLAESLQYRGRWV